MLGISLAVSRPRQVLEVKSQRLLQIFYRFLFIRAATFQVKIGAARDENTIFLDDYIVHALLAFPGSHGDKCAVILIVAINGAGSIVAILRDCRRARSKDGINYAPCR